MRYVGSCPFIESFTLTGSRGWPRDKWLIPTSDAFPDFLRKRNEVQIAEARRKEAAEQASIDRVTLAPTHGNARAIEVPGLSLAEAPCGGSAFALHGARDKLVTALQDSGLILESKSRRPWKMPKGASS